VISYGEDYTCEHGEPSGDCAACLDAETATDSWSPIDLGPYLRGEVKRPEPTVGLVRDDGLRMLYPGKEHSVIGEMESGKSWFSLGCAAAELADGNPVVYIHFEEADPSDTVERLVALGARDEEIMKLFRFVGPERQVSADRLAALLDPSPTLVILDGVNEAMALHKWGIRDEDGAAEFRRCLVKPCTRAGAAVLSGDHVVKDRERRDRGPLGSIHKGNGLTGALILLENAEPFGREQKGRSHVFITKDRPGYLRRHGRADKKLPGKTFMGSITVDDTRQWNPWLELKFWSPTDKEQTVTMKDDPNTAVDEKVYAVVRQMIEQGQPTNITRIRAMAGFANTKTRDALTRLVMAGRLAEATAARDSNLFSIPTRSGDQVDE